MTNIFIHIVKLRVTCWINGFLFFLAQIPIIKKLLPKNLLGNSALKVIVAFFAYSTLFLKTILYKILYLAGFYILPIMTIDEAPLHQMLQYLFFLTLIGGVTNTKFFDPNTEKYYGVMLLRMDAKKYVLVDYLYYMFELFLGYVVGGSIVYVLFSFAQNSWDLFLLLLFTLVMPIYIIIVKNVFIAYKLHHYEKTGNISSENDIGKIGWLCITILLALCYGLPFVGIEIPSFVTLVLFVVMLMLNVWAIKKIVYFDEYLYITKEIYQGNNNKLKMKTKKEATMKKAFSKQISVDQSFESKKQGYGYFNDIFVNRHKKLLVSTSRIIAAVILVLGIAVIVGMFIKEEVKVGIQYLILNSTTALPFVLYFINRGQYVTQTMFMNCDSSLLHYNFYREPKTILAIFTERLKSLIGINMLPTATIAILLPVLLFLSGGTQELWLYPVLAFMVVALSVFFSVHYLVLYYLLQPFTKELKMKSPVYSVITFLTYFICYFILDDPIPTQIFALVVIVFSVVYVPISMILVYKIASKTFKLR